LVFDTLEQTNRPDVIADLLNGLNDARVSVKIDQLPGTASETVRRLMEHIDPRVHIPAMTVAAAMGDEATLQRVRSLLHDVTADPASRLAALTGLCRRKPPKLADDLQRLIAVGQLTRAALQAATTIDDATLPSIVVDRYGSFGKQDRIAAMDFFVARRTSANVLLGAIEQQRIEASELSATQARQIVALSDPSLLKRLEEVWGSARPSSADRLQVIKAWQRKLDPSRIAEANLASGHDIFKKTCAACHKLFGEGQTIGPDLTGANRRNLNYLLSNVIDPSAAVPVDFQLTIVLTQDGRVVSGFISQQSESAMTIQTESESIQIPSEEIDAVKVSAVSMMPDGLLDKLSEEQVRDLFAWMMSNGPTDLSAARGHSE
jgi:putative heme-binding domain-containing protein